MTFKKAKSACPDGGSIERESAPVPALFKDQGFAGIDHMPEEAKTATDWKVTGSSI